MQIICLFAENNNMNRLERINYDIKNKIHKMLYSVSALTDEQQKTINRMRWEMEFFCFNPTILVNSEPAVERWFWDNKVNYRKKMSARRSLHSFMICRDKDDSYKIVPPKPQTKSGPKVSVIVPIYNSENELRRCLKSIVNQTYANLEIILINDGSQDDSSKICDEFASKDSRIRVVHNKNHGLSASKNLGIALATSGIVGFVDSDDFISPRMYEKLVKVMLDKDADIAACSFSRRYTFNNDYIKMWKIKKPCVMSGFEAAYDNCTVNVLANNSWNKIYRKKVFKNILFPDAMYFEDLATTCKLLYSCDKVAYIPDVLYHKVVRNESMVYSVDDKKVGDRYKAIEDNIEFIREKGILSEEELVNYRDKKNDDVKKMMEGFSWKRPEK